MKTKLLLEEEKECNDLANVFLKQMKLNGSKIVGEKVVLDSPCKILLLTPSLYICSPVAYNEIKKSSLEIFPLSHTLQHMKSKMMHCNGISPKTYQWYYDEVVAHLHLICNEMHLKSGGYWNTQLHKLVGYAMETSELNLLEELWALRKLCDEDGNCITTIDDSNANAKSVNQWCFWTVHNGVHNGEFFFNDGSLMGDEFIWRFVHVLPCHKSIGMLVEGFVCNAGSQNACLLSYL